MYNEMKDKLGIANYLVYILIAIIIIVVVIIIIVKSTSGKKEEKPKKLILYSEEQLETIETKYSESFASNMASFKYNIIDYYKDKLGNEKVAMILTLQDLYDKHFIEELSLDDVKCDSENSKVEVTKKSGEYRLDFTLVCGESVTLYTYLGKYDYCEDNDMCEKKIEKKTTEPNKKEEPATPIEEPPVSEPSNKEPTTPEITKSNYTFYEYTLTPSEQVGSYSNWSDWDTKEINSSLMVEVETKEETKTKTEGCTETKEETYISGYNKETYISGYTTKKYKVGTKKVQTGTKQVTINGKIVNQPIYKEEPIYQTKEEPVYATKKVPIYSTRTVTVDNCTDVIKYYRSRNFSYKKGINYIKYSTSDNDQYLLNNGYIKTGNTKEF